MMNLFNNLANTEYMVSRRKTPSSTFKEFGALYRTLNALLPLHLKVMSTFYEYGGCGLPLPEMTMQQRGSIYKHRHMPKTTLCDPTLN
jgi:hypothetical protein